MSGLFYVSIYPLPTPSQSPRFVDATPTLVLCSAYATGT